MHVVKEAQYPRVSNKHSVVSKAKNLGKKRVFQFNSKENSESLRMPTDQSQSLTLSIETLVLKVNVNCHGCHRKVEKILKKIEGVYSVSVDAEQQRVVVIGVADSATLIKKLARSGKHAELWSPKTQQLDLNQELLSLGKTKTKTPIQYQNNKRRAISLDQLMNPELQSRGSIGSERGFEVHGDQDIELEEAEERANLYMDPTGNRSGDGNYENEIGSMISKMGIHGLLDHNHLHGYHDHRYHGYDLGGSLDSGRFQRFQNYPVQSPFMVDNLLGTQYSQNPYAGWLRTNPQSMHAILNNNNKMHDGHPRMYQQY